MGKLSTRCGMWKVCVRGDVLRVEAWDVWGVACVLVCVGCHVVIVAGGFACLVHGCNEKFTAICSSYCCVVVYLCVQVRVIPSLV
jgi:hypothetical protein